MITNLVDQLRRDESEILHAYQDQLGFWSIGVGRLIDPRKNGGISKDESALLLGNDITSKTLELSKGAPWISNVDPIRRAGLVNMAFNLGVPGLLKFQQTLALAQQGNWSAFSDSLLKTLWAKQVGVRADRLAQQFRTGEWQ